jgi:hypothetical protein
MSETKMVGHRGVEPLLLDSKSSVLPLYECPVVENLEPTVRFELTTSRLQIVSSTN